MGVIPVPPATMTNCLYWSKKNKVSYAWLIEIQNIIVTKRINSLSAVILRILYKEILPFYSPGPQGRRVPRRVATHGRLCNTQARI